jgi:hypothetical protein
MDLVQEPVLSLRQQCHPAQCIPGDYSIEPAQNGVWYGFSANETHRIRGEQNLPRFREHENEKIAIFYIAYFHHCHV